MTDTKQELQQRTLRYLTELGDYQFVRQTSSDKVSDGFIRIYGESEAVDAIRRLAYMYGVKMEEKPDALEDVYVKLGEYETLEDFADYIENKIRENVLQYTHCTNDRQGYPNYTRLTFQCGGPTIYAERTPHEAYFTLYGYWGDDKVEITDFDELIPSFYCCDEEA